MNGDYFPFKVAVSRVLTAQASIDRDTREGTQQETLDILYNTYTYIVHIGMGINELKFFLF